MERLIKRLLLELGADDCGIAGAERFGGAPEGFHPTDIFPDFRAAVVFVKRMPSGLRAVDPRIVYAHATELNLADVDRIAYAAALAIEREGGRAVPLPCDSPYEYWDAERTHGRGLLSMRHAALLAGLGHLGRNTLLIHPEFGNLINIGAVLTDLPLQSDPLCETACLPGCRACLNACPQKALDGVTVDQQLCRSYTYTVNARGFSVCNCNRCRMACPLPGGGIRSFSFQKEKDQKKA